MPELIEIDIKEILQNGHSKGMKKLPGFFYSFLERVIKQDEINSVLKQYSSHEGIDFLNGMIDYLNLKLDIRGIENLPDDGRCFFVGNHAFGFVDGLIITKTIYEKYGQLKFIGNEVFLMLPNIKDMVAAVNMFEKSPREYLLALNELYNSDYPITHFPNGDVSRVYKGKVRDRYWHKSFIAKAVSCKRNIVPIHFYGRNSNLFYFIYLLRRFLFINKEIETVLLPREFFNKRNKTIKVRIGKMISYERFDNGKTYEQWAQELRKEIYAI
jgi:putative hemolysin